MIELVVQSYDFAEVIQLIEAARKQAYQAVNKTLIELYWQVGEYISYKLKAAEWGDGVVDQLAQHLALTQSNLRGFTRANLFRMRQFYETYQQDEKVAPLVRQLPWTHNLIILSQSKRPEEREFYLKMAIQEKWSKRELERQLNAALFERVVLNPLKVSSAVTKTHPEALNIFKDSYLVEFLGLPDGHSEADLHQGLLIKLKQFLLELGRDFCFVGSEYPIQVGKRDFALDLLFFHRGLNALVALELKVGRFEPEYLSKLTFYKEALDRDHRKPHENPAIGVLLCASKDQEVVERDIKTIGSCKINAVDESILAIRVLWYTPGNIIEDHIIQAAEAYHKNDIPRMIYNAFSAFELKLSELLDSFWVKRKKLTNEDVKKLFNRESIDKKITVHLPIMCEEAKILHDKHKSRLLNDLRLHRNSVVHFGSLSGEAGVEQEKMVLFTTACWHLLLLDTLREKVLKNLN